MTKEDETLNRSFPKISKGGSIVWVNRFNLLYRPEGPVVEAVDNNNYHHNSLAVHRQCDLYQEYVDSDDF